MTIITINRIKALIVVDAIWTVDLNHVFVPLVRFISHIWYSKNIHPTERVNAQNEYHRHDFYNLGPHFIRIALFQDSKGIMKQQFSFLTEITLWEERFL